jgi:hypothetical protein
MALSTLDWKLDRPYLFFENEAFFRDSISIYHSLIADDPRGVTTDGIRPGAGISRSYLTITFSRATGSSSTSITTTSGTRLPPPPGLWVPDWSTSSCSRE